MQLPAGDRRNVVEDLLDAQIFSSMAKITKDKLAIVVKDIGIVDGAIRNLTDKISMLQSFILKVKNETESNDKEIDTKIAEYENYIKELDCYKTSLEQKKSDLYKTIEDAPEVTTTKTKVVTSAQKIQLTKSNKEQQRAFFEQNDNCPTCKQTISLDFKTEEIELLTVDIGNRNKALETAADMVKTYDARLAEIAEVTRKIKEVDADIRTNQNDKDNILWKIKELNNNKNKATVSVEKEKADLLKSKNDFSDNVDKKAELIDQKSYLDIATLMLKDNGIKATIVKQYIPILNKLINHYLDVMGFFCKFTFDENFADVIHLRQRDNLSYYSLSEGQKRRIDLAIVFAFRKISEAKNICNTNLLFFDDVLGMIDDDGNDSIFNILNDFEDKNIFVVSHKWTLDTDMFDRKLSVSMKNNYSVVTEEICN